jgi:hypothetical protein
VTLRSLRSARRGSALVMILAGFGLVVFEIVRAFAARANDDIGTAILIAGGILVASAITMLLPFPAVHDPFADVGTGKPGGSFVFWCCAGLLTWAATWIVLTPPVLVILIFANLRSA